jgi:hypothetical protein
MGADVLWLCKACAISARETAIDNAVAELESKGPPGAPPTTEFSPDTFAENPLLMARMHKLVFVQVFIAPPSQYATAIVNGESTVDEMLTVLLKKFSYDGDVVLSAVRDGTTTSVERTAVLLKEFDQADVDGKLIRFELRSPAGEWIPELENALKGKPRTLLEAVKKKGLTEVLNDPSWFPELVAANDAMFTRENPMFWVACEEYRELPEEQRRVEAQSIWDDFVKDGAEHEINVKAGLKKTINAGIAEAPADLFASAQREIFNLMNANIQSYSSSLQEKAFAENPDLMPRSESFRARNKAMARFVSKNPQLNIRTRSGSFVVAPSVASKMKATSKLG